MMGLLYFINNRLSQSKTFVIILMALPPRPTFVICLGRDTIKTSRSTTYIQYHTLITRKTNHKTFNPYLCFFGIFLFCLYFFFCASSFSCIIDYSFSFICTSFIFTSIYNKASILLKSTCIFPKGIFFSIFIGFHDGFSIFKYSLSL